MSKKIEITQFKSAIGYNKKTKATIKALSMLRDANSVAQQRGVSLEKVYNG